MSADVTIKRRARRVASDEAHAWARSLALHNPFAKSVLRALALYVNGEGCCFVSFDQIAADTDMSIDTVRRRAAWLDEIGAIVRLPQWIDEYGKRNSENRGKRTTDEIRLLLDADADVVEARAAGDVSPSHQQGSAETVSPSPQQGPNPASENASPSQQQGLNPAQPSVSPRLALAVQPGPESSEPEPEPEEEEDSPLPPKGGEPDDGWNGFEQDWREPILRQSIARQVWSALSAAEKEQARKAARGYVAYRSGQKKPPNVINAHTFLRERDAWLKFAALAPDAKSVSAPVILVPMDSREGRALIALFAVARLGSPDTEGDNFKIRRELTPQVLALADLPPERDWKIFDDRRQHAAWSDLTRAFTGRGVLIEDHIVGERTEPNPNGGNPIFLGTIRKHGFRAPTPWPPSAKPGGNRVGKWEARNSPQNRLDTEEAAN